MFGRKYWFILGIITLTWLIGAIGFYKTSPSDRKYEVLFLAINAFGVMIAAYVSLIASLIKIEQEKIENSFKYIEKWKLLP